MKTYCLSMSSILQAPNDSELILSLDRVIVLHRQTQAKN
ncbi:hypothetical protein NIES2104_18140 [Leptolyngbya sp. NIES-2104]|nr:hypothetical protein NIES2104_18140 [Leptolyngbya sp. NIES-2104]